MRENYSTSAVRDFLSKGLFARMSTVIDNPDKFLYTTNPMQLGGPDILTVNTKQPAELRATRNGRTLCTIKDPFSLERALEDGRVLTSEQQSDYNIILHFLQSIYTVPKMNAPYLRSQMHSDRHAYHICLARGDYNELDVFYKPEEAITFLKQSSMDVIALAEAFHSKNALLPNGFGRAIAPVLLDHARVREGKQGLFFELHTILTWLAKRQKKPLAENIRLNSYKPDTSRRLISVIHSQSSNRGEISDQYNNTKYYYIQSPVLSTLDLRGIYGQLNALSDCLPNYFPLLKPVGEASENPVYFSEDELLNYMGLDRKYLGSIDPKRLVNRLQLGEAIDL